VYIYSGREYEYICTYTVTQRDGFRKEKKDTLLAKQDGKSS